MRADPDVTRPVYYRSVEEAPPIGHTRRPRGSLPTNFSPRRAVPPFGQRGTKKVSVAEALAFALSPPHGIPFAVGAWFARMDVRLRNLSRGSHPQSPERIAFALEMAAPAAPPD